MSSKMTIIEGNSNDKDNVRAYMVKGEPGDDGVSPTITPSKSGSQTTLTIVDGEGTKQAVIDDGFSPTVTTSKTDGVTTVTITDLNGTRTAEIVDGIDLTGGVPTDGVIGFDGVAADIPDGYEVVGDTDEKLVSAKVLWSGRSTEVSVDLTGYSFIEVIFCSNDNFYNSLKVPVSGSTFSRALALCNSYLSDPMSSGGSLYLKYGKATLTQSGVTIKANVEVQITDTASQIRWQGASNTLLYITTIIGYK